MPMETIRIISTTTVEAESQNNSDSAQKIHLTPWDLHFLPLETIQKGLLFHNPINEKEASSQIQHLKHSLSSTLSFFPPLAGRLVIDENEDNTASCYILCNNAGVLFVHAIAENTSVDDILQTKYIPSIVRSFFQLNGAKNYKATSQPPLAVQVTELVDGIFIGCSFNHVVADGKSFWHFMNSWAEISRGCDKISKPPSYERWFLQGIDLPIRFPFTKDNIKPQPQLAERVFHFTKEKISHLKAKANAEAGTNKISSLQAVLTHLWRSVIRNQRVDPQEKVRYMLLVGVRPRMVPPLADDYFGNAGLFDHVTMKARELLECGLGKAAFEMNKMIASHSVEKIKNQYECWVRKPKLLMLGSIAGSNSLATSSSPRFDVYGNDFGWGKPVAVRSGAANKGTGKISVFAGAEQGSIDLEVCLAYEILEALGNDPEFLHVVCN